MLEQHVEHRRGCGEQPQEDRGARAPRGWPDKARGSGWRDTTEGPARRLSGNLERGDSGWSGAGVLTQSWRRLPLLSGLYVRPHSFPQVPQGPTISVPVSWVETHVRGVSSLQKGGQDWIPGLFLFKPVPSATAVTSYWLFQNLG